MLGIHAFTQGTLILEARIEKLTPLHMLWCNPDLKTISKRVESEQYYITLEMFASDMKRMFNNARTYNSPDTIYYKCTNR